MKKVGNALWIVITVAALALAAWLPGRFAADAPTDAVATDNPRRVELTRAQKAELSRLYMSMRSDIIDYIEYTIDSIEELEEFVDDISEPIAQKISNTYDLIAENGLFVESDFRETTADNTIGAVISDRNGGSVKLLRKMKGGSGAWYNWRQLVFDTETAEVYFFYSSSEFLANSVGSNGNPELPSNPVDAAYAWLKITGYDDVKSVDWDGVETSYASVTYLNGKEEVRYRIKCFYHPSVNFELEITMLGE